MKLYKGVWLPDHETHLVEWCDKNGEMVDGKTTYQYKKLVAALDHVKSWRVAVDVGAHVGFWSMHLRKRFTELHAFEPVEEHRRCFVRNMGCDIAAWTGGLLETWEDDHNLWLHPIALGKAPGRVSMTIPPGSSGGTHIGGAGDIEVRTLDSFGLNDVGFLKIDVEGFELQVLQGAVATLKRCRPTIIVEQKAHTPGGLKHLPDGGKPAVDFLQALGAKQRVAISGDYVLSFD